MTSPGDGMADTAAATPSDAPSDTTAAGAGQTAGPGVGEPGHDRAAGSSMGRYEIVGVLGAGGMGKVYRARDPDLNRDLAIKVLRRAVGSGGATGGLEHRLLREAQAMAKLKHANLATVYDVGTVDGEVFIAFEFIDGDTLGVWARGGRTVGERLAALIAAGRGLEAAHSAGVIHRDFKPDNVLVGRDGVVKVVDFGLARGIGEVVGNAVAARSDALTVDLTVTGSILGTPAYMAPEQHRGSVSDARADQFGFAVAAWEILFGERPFRGTTIDVIATAICTGAITPPPAGAEGGEAPPPGIEPALRRALSVEPGDRFANLGALLAALSAAPVAVVAAPPPVASRSRRRGVLVAGGVVGAIAIGTGGLLLLGGSPASSSERRAGAAAAAAVVADAAAPTSDEQELIRMIISNNIERVSDCYESALADDPLLPAGTVQIEFEIGGFGRVVSTRIVSDEFAGKRNIATCVAAKSLEWQFPPPDGNGTMKVTYPFRFEPLPFDIVRVDAQSFVISHDTWKAWMAHPKHLSRGVNIVPAIVGGKQAGWKLYGISEGSLLARLGFINGDTITHINDAPLTSPETTMVATQTLSPSMPITITYRRRTETGTYTYLIGR